MIVSIAISLYLPLCPSIYALNETYISCLPFHIFFVLSVVSIYLCVYISENISLDTCMVSRAWSTALSYWLWFFFHIFEVCSVWGARVCVYACVWERNLGWCSLGFIAPSFFKDRLSLTCSFPVARVAGQWAPGTCFLSSRYGYFKHAHHPWLFTVCSTGWIQFPMLLR